MLLFAYATGAATAQFYYVPVGQEEALFGNGISLKVTLAWDGSTTRLFFNDVQVQATNYTKQTPNWTSVSNFNLGAYEYANAGGFNTLDDIVDEFTVSGPQP
jgi:hypothetical protein